MKTNLMLITLLATTLTAFAGNCHKPTWRAFNPNAPMGPVPAGYTFAQPNVKKVVQVAAPVVMVPVAHRAAPAKTAATPMCKAVTPTTVNWLPRAK